MGNHSLWQTLKVGACTLLAALSMQAHAQSDPPALAGRVAAVSGVAWYFDTERNVWTQLLRNHTIAQGDRVRVDAKSRVSLSVGSTSIWLDSGADLDIVQMDDDAVQLRLEKGALGLAMRSREAVNEYRVLTREGQLYPDDLGLYRIEQMPQGTRAQSLQGRLRFESDRSGAVQRAWLRDGEQAEFWWADGPRTEHQNLLRDSFAVWLQTQAANDGSLVTNQDYVSPEMTGAEDLARHGVWEQAPDYGAVWIPTQVAPGWEPYRDGRWQWTTYWGWSWVDDMPWGFAPFHYGQWVMWRGRWCWTPGRYVARPVYAPAMVTWVRPPTVVIGVGIRQPPPRGSWTPLRPREVYVPHYRHSEDYITRLNRQYDGRPGPGGARPPVGPQRPDSPPRNDNRDRGNPRDTLPWKGSEGPRPSDGPRRPDNSGPSRGNGQFTTPGPAMPPPAPVPQAGSNAAPAPIAPRVEPGAGQPPANRQPWPREREPGFGRGREIDGPQQPQPQPARPRDPMPQPAVTPPPVVHVAPPQPQPQPQPQRPVPPAFVPPPQPAAPQPPAARPQPQPPAPAIQAPQPRPAPQQDDDRRNRPRNQNDER